MTNTKWTSWATPGNTWTVSLFDSKPIYFKSITKNFVFYYVNTTGGRSNTQPTIGFATSYLASDLLPNTNYTFQMQAVSSLRGGSNVTDPITARTMEDSKYLKNIS